MILNVGDGLFAVTDLHWETIPTSEIKKRQRQSAKEKRAYTTVSYAEEEGESGGMALSGYGDSTDPALKKQGRNKFFSLAGLAALSFPQGHYVIAEQMPSEGEIDTFWFCAINQGQIIESSDKTGSYEEIQALIDEHLALMPDEAPTFSGSAIQFFVEGAEEESFLEIVNPDLVAQALIKAQNDTLVIVVLLCGVIMLFGGLGWFVKGILFPPKPVAVLGLSLEQMLEQQRIEARGRLEARIAEVGARQSLSATAGRAFAKLRDLPVSVGGWQINTSVCMAGVCRTEYTNQDMTLLRHIENALSGKCTRLASDVNGTKLICESEYEAVSLVEINESPIGPSTSLGQLRDRAMMITRALAEQSAYAITEPRQVSFTGMETLAASEGFKTVDWTVQLRPHDGYRALAAIGNEYLWLSEININWTGDTLEVKGGLAFRNGNSSEDQ